MRLFLSYRRDDTGGRAGRLFDALAARFGSDDVFQDVTAMSPGVRFAEQVAHAIAVSDAVLVVIGPAWLTSTTPEGDRRIDQPDDFVRREVAAALAGDVRVVPVLVDGAVLPTSADLPAELADLVERQAVSLADSSWHQDVEQLVRRLRGEPTVVLGETRRGRRRMMLAGGAIVAAAIAIVAVAVLANDSNGDDEGDGSSSEPTGCPAVGPDWVELPIVEDPFTDVATPDGQALVEITGAHSRDDVGEWLVIVDVTVENVNPDDPSSDQDEIYSSYAMFDALVVDGYAQDEVACQDSPGERQLAPGRKAIGRVGYLTDENPIGVALSLDVAEGGGNVPVTDG